MTFPHGLPGTEVYAELESFNPFGSVKDRVAWSMLRDHLAGAVAERRTETGSVCRLPQGV